MTLHGDILLTLARTQGQPLDAQAAAVMAVVEAAQVERFVERVAERMYLRVMEETRDEWPHFDRLPVAAQRNWRALARAALRDAEPAPPPCRAKCDGRACRLPAGHTGMHTATGEHGEHLWNVGGEGA
jgi:hypothetical protein